METHEKTFNTICRVCLNHGVSGTMVSLTDNSDENGLSSYGISFEKLTNISVKQNNYLPTKICQKCKKSLEEVATLMIQSEKSDRRLSKLICFSLKQDLNEEMVKEVVHQYTLFSENFTEDSNASSSWVNTSHYNENISAFSEKPVIKSEGKYHKIKVEVDVEQISSASNIFANSVSHENIKTTSDNVDIFLHSIEKLVTTKVEDIQAQIKRERKPKKDVKPKVIEQDFTCHICHKILKTAATFRIHMDRHDGRRFICDQCGKGYPIQFELTQHQIASHGTDSALECDHCAFKASGRLQLIEHIRLHTGERPFTCEKCGLTFRRNAIYRNHLKCHGKKTILCEHCPSKFYRRSEMLAHMNSTHDRVYVFVCKVCNVTYAKPGTVRQHMLVKHGIPKEKQGKIIKINKTDNKCFKNGKEGYSELTDL